MYAKDKNPDRDNYQKAEYFIITKLTEKTITFRKYHLLIDDLRRKFDKIKTPCMSKALLKILNETEKEPYIISFEEAYYQSQEETRRILKNNNGEYYLKMNYEDYDHTDNILLENIIELKDVFSSNFYINRTLHDFKTDTVLKLNEDDFKWDFDEPLQTFFINLKYQN